MGWLREVLSAAKVAAVVVLLGAVIATLDPMGLDDAADKHSADVVARMTAPFYGDRGPKGDQPPVGQSAITTIEISDNTLRDLGLSWPAPRAFYVDLLDVLAPETGPRPAAIFLDYILLSDLGDAPAHAGFIAKVRGITKAKAWEDDPSCRVTPAAKIRCIVDKGGVPVILGKPYPPDVCAADLGGDISQMLPLEQSAVLTPLGWPNAAERAMPVLRREGYRRQLAETLGDEAGAVFESCRLMHPVMEGKTHRRLSPFEEGGTRMTWWGVRDYDLAPAGAMFAALCQQRRHEKAVVPATCDDFISPEGVLTWTEPEAAVIAWGSVPSQAFLHLRPRIYENLAERDKPCRDETRSLRRAAVLGWRQLSSAIGDGVAATRVPCPYHPTFDYAVLKTELENGGTPLGQDIRDGYLADRIVLVGAAMVASTDWTESVVHGRLAGVHYHAMMLDNLIEKGDGVLRTPPPLFPDDSPLSALNIDWGEILEFATAFFVVLVVELGRRRMERREKRDGRALLWIVGVFVWAGILMAIATWITITLHWKPVNIIGLFTLTMVDAAASFWSIEGMTWVVSTGWLGARTQSRRASRMATDVILRLASRVGLLFSLRAKSSRPPQPEGADAPNRPSVPKPASPKGE